MAPLAVCADSLPDGEFIYFWPLFTGTSIPEDLWRDRMWLDTWV
ncbi:hypothetical protein [Streptomyces sp. CB00072]|nr:hypothetical protein [Streptomyces sp. CB00072]